jgi:hypothetical protein
MRKCSPTESIRSQRRTRKLRIARARPVTSGWLTRLLEWLNRGSIRVG